MLLGVKCVIAESYERIHRSNLVGMGILPLEFINGENAEKLSLTGSETFEIDIEKNLTIGNKIKVKTEKLEFYTKLRLDTDPEIEYFKNNGILIYVLRKLIK
jgi:aconitate hydratase